MTIEHVSQERDVPLDMCLEFVDNEVTKILRRKHYQHRLNPCQDLCTVMHPSQASCTVLNQPNIISADVKPQYHFCIPH